MALDGIMFEGVSVRVRRPNDYNPAAAAALGPSVPNPALNLAAIGLSPGGMGAQVGFQTTGLHSKVPLCRRQEICNALSMMWHCSLVTKLLLRLCCNAFPETVPML